MSDRLDRHMEKLEKNRELIERVEYCQEHGDECNDWEDEFLESIKDWLTKGSELTSAQFETLEKIEYIVEWGRAAYWSEVGDE